MVKRIAEFLKGNIMNKKLIYKRSMTFLILMAFTLVGMGCHEEGSMKDAHNRATMDIVDTAVSANKFTTLVTAVKAADLVRILKSPGPFTVFAPTDEAFAKLPAGTIPNLLKPENKQKLASILTYHVVPGKVTASEVIKINRAKTVNGQSLSIKTIGGSVMVDNAMVIKADIHCSNGVIHVIDTVVLPK